MGLWKGIKLHNFNEYWKSSVLDVVAGCGVGVRGGGYEKKYNSAKCYKEESSLHEDLSLINNFINRSLLVPRASDNILVIHRDVTAKHR